MIKKTSAGKGSTVNQKASKKGPSSSDKTKPKIESDLVHDALPVADSEGNDLEKPFFENAEPDLSAVSFNAEDDVIDVAPLLKGPKNSPKTKNTKSLSKVKANLPAPASSYGGLDRQDPLVTYLDEIRKYAVMNPEEEREVAIKYKETGDPALAQKLVMANLRFVVKIAAEYSKFGPRMIDVIQEGNLGLMHAVKEFNPYRGVRLITYAVWWIRGYIREYLMRQYSMVRLGTTHNQKKLFYQLQQEEKKLESLGFKVDTPLLSAKFGISEEEIDSMKMRLKGRDLSLDQPLDDDSRSVLMDLQSSADSDNVQDKLEKEELLHRLRKDVDLVRPRLNAKEIYILENRLLAEDPMTLQEAGDVLGITRERARQLEARVILRIKEELEKDLGEVFSSSKD